MCTRLPMIVLSLGAMLMAGGCESTFDYYPHHEEAVACSDIHKGTDPGDFGGFTNKFTSSTAGTNPATGPATSLPTVPAMSIGR
jgi:hypothetical protein